MPIESIENVPVWENTRMSYLFPEQQSKDYTNAAFEPYAPVEELYENECEQQQEYQCTGHYISQPDSKYRWWIPQQGIHENIIRLHVQPYLGPDAVVAPGPDIRGRAGYFISAYRTFTLAMIQDMQADSIEYLALMSKEYPSATHNAMEDIRMETNQNAYSDDGAEEGGGGAGEHKQEEGQESDEDSDEMSNDEHS